MLYVDNRVGEEHSHRKFWLQIEITRETRAEIRLPETAKGRLLNLLIAHEARNKTSFAGRLRASCKTSSANQIDVLQQSTQVFGIKG